MNLTVNGEIHKHTGKGNLYALLEEIGTNPEHSALTVNGDVIPSKKWGTFLLSENDSVEILTFVGGG